MRRGALVSFALRELWPPPGAWALGEELHDSGMGGPGHFHLRHVAAVELEMTRARQCGLDMAREPDRHEPVAPSPDEERIGLKRWQPGPEPLLAVGLLEVDLACRGVEGGASGARLVGAQELVDADGRPALAGARDQPTDKRFHDRPWRGLEEPELRPHETQHRQQRPVAAPRERGREEHEAPRALGVTERHLHCDARTEAVADHVDAFQRQRVEHVDDRVGEEARIVGRAKRLVGVPKTRKVGDDDVKVVGKRGDGGEEGRLRPAEAVEREHRFPSACFEQRHARPRGLDRAEPYPPGLRFARRGEKPHADVEIAANGEASAEIGLHPDAQIRG